MSSHPPKVSKAHSLNISPVHLIDAGDFFLYGAKRGSYIEENIIEITEAIESKFNKNNIQGNIKTLNKDEATVFYLSRKDELPILLLRYNHKRGEVIEVFDDPDTKCYPDLLIEAAVNDKSCKVSQLGNYLLKTNAKTKLGDSPFEKKVNDYRAMAYVRLGVKRSASSLHRFFGHIRVKFDDVEVVKYNHPLGDKKIVDKIQQCLMK